MQSEKEIKKIFYEKTDKHPEQFYPVHTLQKRGFTRHKCTSCARNYWRIPEDVEQRGHKKNTCGDIQCHGSYSFVGKSPATRQLNYVEALQEYLRIHEKLGYTPVQRYPVVARWNPTVDFTIAGIACFQPYVVSGEVDPPANPLAMPQFCLRFNDIDNVGITAAHYVGFIMLGEQTFVPPKEYDVNKYMDDHLTWLNEGLGLDDKYLTIHEDFWAGGGNFGPSMEFFSGGLELSNQVYMQYEITPEGYQELDIKVLDMGQGHERIPWFTQGLPTSYESTFPPVMKKLRELTKIPFDNDFMTRFAPLAGQLNTGEVDNLDEAWKRIAQELQLTVTDVKAKVLPNAALYSVAEHARALLFALADGALPSNTGGYYNLRVILRRALGFIEQYSWQFDLCDVCTWHAEYLKPLFPDLLEQLPNVQKIIEVEKLKYYSTREKTKELIAQLVTKQVTTDELIELYDSKGISPEELSRVAKEQGIEITVPDNFYSLVAARHEQHTAMQTVREEEIPVGDVPATQALYFDDWKKTEFVARVLAIVDHYVVLDQTAFYPVSGGQAADKGMLIANTKKGAITAKVKDVIKQGNLIIHKIDTALPVGGEVKGTIDFERRKQLTQHHTTTHIINAAARRVLGDHINQASARKDVDRAHIDLTHYQGVTEEELQQIENEANKIVAATIPIHKSFVPRTEAEQRYGVRIYQGGVAPGKLLRIVNIEGVDVEACGGTHLDNTKEAEQIKIISTTKVKDGVIRLTFCAGKAAKQKETQEHSLLIDIAALLEVTPAQVPGRAEELFTKWKKARKAVNKDKNIDLAQLELQSTREDTGDLLTQTADLLNTQPEHVLNVLQRFLRELDDYKRTLSLRDKE
ncbi:alanine--tRNA ligase [Candidatus Woesearchaeota archaeon]|nr:alanine--tRNA ligase [Candidatus Woesearchaeota archaeon]